MSSSSNSKVTIPSSDLYWRTLEEGTKRGLPKRTASRDELGPKILDVLQQAGGSATLFEITARTGEPEEEVRRAVRVLASMGQVVRKTAGEDTIVLQVR